MWVIVVKHPELETVVAEAALDRKYCVVAEAFGSGLALRGG